MARLGKVRLVFGLPGYSSLKAFVEEFLNSPGSIFTSTNDAVLAQARDLALAHPIGIRRLEEGSIEVLPLSELTRMFANLTDLPTYPLASADHQKVFAALASQELPPESSLYSAADLPGFHEALSKTMREIRRHRIPIEVLENMGGRARDIAYLIRVFEEVLTRNRMTTLTQRIEKIIEKPPCRPRELKKIFWTGESTWVPLHIEWLRWMQKAGIDIAMLLERHPTEPNFYCAHVPLESSFISAQSEVLQQDFTQAACCFGFLHSKAREIPIKIFDCADDVLECEWALRESLSLPFRLDNTTLYCTQPDKYAPLLYAASTRFGIRLDFHRRTPLLSNSFARFCLHALKALIHPSVDMISSLAGNSYSRIPPSEREAISVSIRSCERKENPWEELANLAQEGTIPAYFARLTAWRENAIFQPRTLSEWLRALNQLISQMPWLDESVGNSSRTAERDTAAQVAMMRSLELSFLQCDINRRYTFEDFVHHAESVWRSEEYFERQKGDLKVVNNAYEIGNAEHLIVVGLVEGALPSRRTEDPLLLDEERRRINELNPAYRLPVSFEIAQEERREFHRLLCSANSLLVSWSRERGGQAEVVSSFLNDLKLVAPIQEMQMPYQQRFPVPASTTHPIDVLPGLAWHADSIDEQTHLEFIEKLDDDTKKLLSRIEVAVENSEIDKISNEEVLRKLSRLPQPLRFSHLRYLKRCPFQYLTMAIMDLRKKRYFTMWEHIRSILRNTDMLTVRSQGELKERLREGLRKKLDELQGEISREELDLFEISAERILDSFAKREFSTRELWQLRPYQQNVSLSEAGLRNTINHNGKKVEITEQLDLIYRTEDKAWVALRYGFVDFDIGLEGSGDELSATLLESGILFSLKNKDDSEKYVSIVEDPIKEERVAVGRSVTHGACQWPHNKKAGLTFKDSPHPLINLRKSAAKELIELLNLAISSELQPKPGYHCEHCGFASLCRRATNTRTHEVYSENNQEWI
ncbi:MAG TPA: hypothetical protein VNK96_05310 [Fimbriimonadales bacterium]|nr:hypothetical protein [Fimbriimonadales bacterium]